MHFNKTIRIGAIKAEPFVYSSFVEFKRECDDCGVELELAYSVLHNFLHLNVTGILFSNDSEMEAAIQRNEIDFTGNTKRRDYSSVYRMWHSTPSTMYLGIGFFVKSPKESKIVNPIFSFSWDLWLCIIFLTAFLHLGYQLISTRFRLTFLTSHFTYILWSIITTLLMEMYSNVITTDLITKIEGSPLFNDLMDLGRKLLSKECRLVINSQYIIYNSTIKKTVVNPQHNQSWAEMFRAAYTVNYPIVVENSTDLFHFVRNSSCVVGLDYVGYDKTLYGSLCGIDVKMFPEEILYRPYVYYHNLDMLQTFINDIFISDAIRQLSNLLMHKYTQKYFEHHLNCLELLERSEFTFSLHRLYYCFSIFIIGILVSGLIVLMQQMKIYILRQTRGQQVRRFVIHANVEESET